MINKGWDIVLKEEFGKDYYRNLDSFVKCQYKENICFPEYNNIFNALRYTDYEDVKVVILGQDPYHGVGEAHGLSFSVGDNVKRPPSLVNIIKELYSDLGVVKENNDLTLWAKQGVLLINSIMSVQKDKPLSHKNKGWEIFTDMIISKLNDREKPIVFILWGGFARGKKKLITNSHHLIVESVHPSSLSAYNGFFGSKPFSKTNNFLISKNMEPIDFKK